MIYEAFELVRTELHNYVRTFSNNTTVKLGGVADITTPADNTIVLTLVNLEEEASLKNTSPYQRNAAGGFDLKNPPVFLNLYLLVTAHNALYETALKLLSRVVQCLQGKNQYTLANSPDASLTDTEPRLSQLRVTIDLCSLSFEKINQLWGTLGGRQLPFVVYKMRVVEEEAERQIGGGGAILSIESKFEGVNPSAEN